MKPSFLSVSFTIERSASVKLQGPTKGSGQLLTWYFFELDIIVVVVGGP